MESTRFDALSRAFAARTSRRDALRRFGLGGLGAGALAAVGLTEPALAADAAVCTLTITAPVATGPDKGTSYDGDLSLTIGSSGAIDVASMKLANGKTHKAVGQATGRAINLRVDLGGGKTLALTGTGEQDLLLCRGQVDGTFGGPDVADLGTWRAVKKSAAAGGSGNAAGASATATGGAGNGNSAGSGTTPAPVQTTPPPNSTTTTAPPTTTKPTTTTTTSTTTTAAPGPCAKTGESCAVATCCVGFCGQGDICDCQGDGQECVPTGTGGCCNGAPCNPAGNCGALPPAPCPAGQTNCGGTCVDLSGNAANCGACGKSCPLGAVCTGGACVAPKACLPDGADCTLDGDCCGGFCIVGVLGVHDYCSH